jgi:hypothetical protein
MGEFLHALGLCPDSMSHLDLLDVIIFQWNQLQLYFYTILSYLK